MKFVLAALITVALGNILYLDWQFFVAQKPQKESSVVPDKVVAPVAQNDQFCSSGCLAAIAQSTTSAATDPVAAQQSQSQSAPASSAVKEYFIPLGSASFTSTSMADVPGLAATIDPANYPNISQVFFEVSVTVPTGNETVNVQLFNETAQHPVWFSNVFFSGGTNGQLLVSQPITLDPGSNLYQVQMQTQLTYPATIDQARIHILLD